MTDTKERDSLLDYLALRGLDKDRQGRRWDRRPMGQPMGCAYPVKVRSPHGAEVIWVGCGRCIACLVKRRDDWVLRMWFEAQDHAASSFTTYTYRDRPDRPDGWFGEWHDEYDEDFDLFMKRERVAAARAGLPRIRYFRVTEKGDRTGRYHHHVMMFGRACSTGLLKGHMPERANHWGLGFAYDAPAALGTMKYVAEYCTKLYSRDELARISMSGKPGVGFGALERAGRRLGDVMRGTGRAVQVPSRIPAGMDGWKIKRERDRGREPGLPLIGNARKHFIKGVQSAGCEVVPDQVLWLPDDVEDMRTRDPERLPREAGRERSEEQARGERAGERARARFKAGRL